MKKAHFISLLLLSSAALAASSSHGGGYGVDGEDFIFPASTVISQIVNLVILLAIIYFWQGKAIAQYFRSTRENFLKSVEEASQSKKNAEVKMQEVKNRVSTLKANYQNDVNEAKNNAKESYRTQLANAKNEAVRIKDTALGSLESEVQKEIENLRLETYKKSAGIAEEKLGSHLSADQQKAWNNHFATEVKGVH